MLESLILGIVFDEDLTGYNIKKNIEKSFGVFYKASFGSLYPALKRLTGKKYVTTYEQPQGGRQKIFYHITEDGKNSFLEWLSSPMNILDGTNLNLAKVYFFDRLPEEIRDIQLSNYENNNIKYLHELEAIESRLSKMDHIDCFYYKMSTLYYGILVTQKTIEWCHCIRERKKLDELIINDAAEWMQLNERGETYAE